MAARKTGLVRLGTWWRARRGRLVPAAVFLAVSLAVFVCGNRLLPSGAEQVARRYMDAATAYDYMEIYRLLDPAVLTGELARSGMDPADMEAVARANGGQVERYVDKVQGDYGVAVAFSYRLGGERALPGGELAELEALYAADGLPLELLEARRVSVRASAQLSGDGWRETLTRELTLTAIRTDSGWSLDRDSTHLFLTLLYDLPGFAQEKFGG